MANVPLGVMATDFVRGPDALRRPASGVRAESRFDVMKDSRAKVSAFRECAVAGNVEQAAKAPNVQRADRLQICLM
jgi:hypothetical protein